jgi:hypothetical protein
MLKERSPQWIPQVPRFICRHHWVIEPANGPTSQGECRKCGSQKTFRNILSDTPWSEWLGPGERPEATIPIDMTPVPEGDQGQEADKAIMNQGGSLI